jgi:hypothetical protein
MFGSNIVGPTFTKEGRVGEAGTRGREARPRADSTGARGPPEADGNDARGQQSAVCRSASVHAKPWSPGSSLHFLNWLLFFL